MTDSLAAKLRAAYFGSTSLTTQTRFDQLPPSERARWEAVVRAALESYVSEEQQ